MSVDRQVSQAPILPVVVLINAHPDQVRHDVGEPVIVVPFYPDHFNVALGIRELADEAQEFPMFLRETSEIQVGKNIAQQNQPLKTILLQDLRGFPGAACRSPQMQVGEDQRVVRELVHIYLLTKQC